MNTSENSHDSKSDSHEGWRAESLPLLAEAVAALKGEDRPGQRDLATAVTDAIRIGHHLVSEAPTGSGKSLAYLVPAIASGLRVVVATSTIALQDQLIGKDLPQLASATDIRFTATALKGRANYVCLSKIRTADAPETLFDQRPGDSFAEDLKTVRDFSEASPTGDRAELPGSIPDASWAAFSCTGQECP
ncbi:MAG: DEAD/DEAH box helicase, partial [Actinomycetes bacterium]